MSQPAPWRGLFGSRPIVPRMEVLPGNRALSTGALQQEMRLHAAKASETYFNAFLPAQDQVHPLC